MKSYLQQELYPMVILNDNYSTDDFKEFQFDIALAGKTTSCDVF